MLELTAVPSVKFDILLPASYKARKNGKTKHVQMADVIPRLQPITQKYKEFGGYTASNPYAAPPLVGGYRDEPQEQNLFLSVIIPAATEILQEATKDILVLVSELRRLYHQDEILTLSYCVTRYVPVAVKTAKRPTKAKPNPSSEAGFLS